jgi:photosystem II stability/assembly factor-like uncharacterized protein
MADGLGPGYSTAVVVDPEDPATLYAGQRFVHGGGQISKSTDGGGHWTALDTGIGPSTVNDLVINPARPNTVYAATKRWGVFKSVDGGQSWDTIDAGLATPTISSLAIDAAAPATLIATFGTEVYRTTNGGVSWRRFSYSPVGDNLPVLVSAPTIDSGGSRLYVSAAGYGVYQTPLSSP